MAYAYRRPRYVIRICVCHTRHVCATSGVTPCDVCVAYFLLVVSCLFFAPCAEWRVSVACVGLYGGLTCCVSGTHTHGMSIIWRVCFSISVHVLFAY